MSLVQEHIGEGSENAPTNNYVGRKDKRVMPITMLHSTYRGRRTTRLTMLCFIATFLLAGCAATPAPTPAAASSTQKNSSPATVLNAAESKHTPEVTDNQYAAQQPQPEPTAEPAPAPPPAPEPEPKPAPKPLDPGALQLVASLNSAVATKRSSSDEHVTISVANLRNHSRCRSDEFQSLLERLAEELSRAGEQANVAFIADADSSADYHLHGTAYLVTSDGFDLWEVYLTLQPAASSWTLWTAPDAVHILRQPRPRQQQFFLSRNW